MLFIHTIDEDLVIMQVESGFEDDSELFGAFTATPSPVGRDPWGSSSSTPGDVFSPLNTVVTPSKSPWATAPQDPFSPPRKFNASPTPPPAQPVAASVPAPGVMAFKPTIIRPKVKPNSSPSVSRAKSAASPMVCTFLQFENCYHCDGFKLTLIITIDAAK